MSAQARPEAQAPATVRTITRTFTRRLSSTRRGVRLARLLVVRRLDAWECPSELSGDAAAIVAELAANAVTHGRVAGRDFEVELVLTGSTLRIEVADTRAGRRPEVAVPGPDCESGRGLLLVSALATRWGVAERRGPGKTVRAEPDT
ncbi:ATP-binding protein [Streptomyces sp. NA02950]|uniref:ATP-binding protein n=1 Tax=Streptomyces sp. NA02950 TaxID=2742137 RepID=UPI0015915FE4|nr:ATP-binding protein [Streptomyces sp. NA02950]QKV91687.1 ATP-binding protein [Streptomyces sp. NA02950]